MFLAEADQEQAKATMARFDLVVFLLSPLSSSFPSGLGLIPGENWQITRHRFGLCGGEYAMPPQLASGASLRNVDFLLQNDDFLLTNDDVCKPQVGLRDFEGQLTNSGWGSLLVRPHSNPPVTAFHGC